MNGKRSGQGRKSFCALAVIWLAVIFSSLSHAQAQPLTLTLEGWGQTYRPAAIASFEARAGSYPWIRAETQVWTGQSPLLSSTSGDVVVLAAHLREPTGHFEARGGRFVLTTGAVRPVHIDGGYLRMQSDWGMALEVFSGAPVVPRFASRAYDWLAGTRLSQRVGEWGALGASYVQRRDHGEKSDEELGADAVLYLTQATALSGRFSYDLVSRGISEINVTGSLGNTARRLELFGTLRNASLILPATSLFSVLSNAPSMQAGASGRYRVAPRLWVDALAAYRALDDARGARLRAGATLWLDDEGKGAIEGGYTRDGVQGQRWQGVRTLVYRDVLEDLRLMAELELVRPDASRDDGPLWPWGRLSGRYTLFEVWQLSAGVEGSSSPQFVKLFQALFRLAYTGGST